MRFVLALAVALVLYGLLPLPWWAYMPANLGLAFVLIAAARRRGHTFHELGLHPRTLLRGTLVGLAAAATVFGAVALGWLVTRGYPQSAGLAATQTDVGPLGLAFEVLVRIPIGTALVEAIVFHGVLFAAVQRVRSTAAAVVVTSITFGLWHIGPTLRELRETGAVLDPVFTITGMVGITMLGGVVFGVMRLLGKNLVAAALTHWSMNAAGLLAAFLVAAR